MSKCLIFFLLLCSCGRDTLSKLKEPINPANDPANLPGAEGELVTLPDSLPASGNPIKPSWTAYWYPYSDGSMAKVVEKYDVAINDSDKKASGWEWQQTNQFKTVSWAGHCNGVSSAGTSVDEPKHPVTYNNVTFSVDDIKALLADVWQASGTVVGERCNDQPIEYDPNGRMINSACRNINPASFHILVTNFMGIYHKPIIANIGPVPQVWNWPITSFEVKLRENLTVRDVNVWMFGVQDKDTYDYNPDAKSFIYYQTAITLLSGSQKIYEYILELDKGGKIIGGEWFRNAKKDHPNFLWRATTPATENPYLDIKVVYDIYNKSL